MCELVLFIPPVLQGDEDAQVVRSSHDAHACTGKLRAQLIVASCGDALLWTVDVEGGNGRVVRCLLGEVGNSDGLVITFEAVGGARGCRGGCLEGGVGIFDLPVTLRESATGSRTSRRLRTLKNSPNVEL
jgi:hypothetical protein